MIYLLNNMTPLVLSKDGQSDCDEYVEFHRYINTLFPLNAEVHRVVLPLILVGWEVDGAGGRHQRPGQEWTAPIGVCGGCSLNSLAIADFRGGHRAENRQSIWIRQICKSLTKKNIFKNSGHPSNVKMLNRKIKSLLISTGRNHFISQEYTKLYKL